MELIDCGKFLIGKYPVTQKEYQEILGDNPSRFEGDNKPVERVSWYDAVEFCNKLSEKEGLQKAYSGKGDNITCDFNSNGYRLPTEAEWEFAARGGNKSMGYKYSGSNQIDEVAWYDGNSNKTCNVGTKLPNELGIYDMSGNVWEWCWDWYDNSKSLRVNRGGGWYSDAEYCRVAHRYGSTPEGRGSGLGFRLVRTKNSYPIMTPNEYQEKCKETMTSECKSIFYLLFGLAAEAGEVVGKHQKWLRGDFNRENVDDEYEALQKQVIPELGDVLWFLTSIADYYDTTLEKVMEINIEKLKKRQHNNTIKGDGDER